MAAGKRLRWVAQTCRKCDIGVYYQAVKRYWLANNTEVICWYSKILPKSA